MPKKLIQWYSLISDGSIFRTKSDELTYLKADEIVTNLQWAITDKVTDTETTEIRRTNAIIIETIQWLK